MMLDLTLAEMEFIKLLMKSVLRKSPDRNFRYMAEKIMEKMEG